MARQRTLVIGLDGFEISLAERMMEDGLLPNMKTLSARSARFDLDHGRAKYTGLAWEHFSTGKTPEALRRHSAVDFDPARYRVAQAPTRAEPMLALFDRARIAIFDLPYCDLGRAPRVRGLTNWGAHDPGVAQMSDPPGIAGEMERRFGPYRATDYIYGFVWPDPGETERAGRLLAEAVAQRSEATIWLFGERCPDWDIGIVVVSEAHSGLEMLWHGVDPAHPLHDAPSGPAARAGVEAIYTGIDRMIGDLAAAFPDAALAVFAMHGMGPNQSDLPGMLLLPELLFRHRFGRPYMTQDGWTVAADGSTRVGADFDWFDAMIEAVPPLWKVRRDSEIAAETAGIPFDYDHERDAEPIDWMPAARYQPFWPHMDAFAVPAFYDGRVRLNLAGREAHGRVRPDDAWRTLDGVAALLDECRDVATGEKVVSSVHFPQGHPRDLGRTQADMECLWHGAPTGFVHPRLGTIGPVPFRRTGGHSGDRGFAWFAGDAWHPGPSGRRSAFDMLPTLARLYGEERAVAQMSGSPIALEPA